MTAHALLGPSSAKRWMNCTASVDLILKSQRKPEVTDAAAEGSAAHLILEQALLEKLFTRGLIDDIVRIARVRREVYALDPEKYDLEKMRQDALRACEVLLNIIECDPDAKVFVEQKVTLNGISEAVWGTADCVIWLPTRSELWVVDYKYGRVDVSAVRNEQLSIYLLGVLQSLIPRAGRSYVKWRTMIIQPRSQEYLSIWEVDRTWLDGDFKPRLIKAICTIDRKLFKDSDWYFGQDELRPEFVVDEAGCRFCPVMAECPAVRKKAIEACNFKPIGEVEPPPLEELLPLLPVLKQWISAVEDEAVARLADGGTVPGYALKATLGHRRWQSEDHVISFLQGTDLMQDEFAPRKLLSPAQMDKLVRKSSKKIAPADLQMYSARSPGNPRLVKTENGET